MSSAAFRSRNPYFKPMLRMLDSRGLSGTTRPPSGLRIARASPAPSLRAVLQAARSISRVFLLQPTQPTLKLTHLVVGGLPTKRENFSKLQSRAKRSFWPSNSELHRKTPMRNLSNPPLLGWKRALNLTASRASRRFPRLCYHRKMRDRLTQSTYGVLQRHWRAHRTPSSGLCGLLLLVARWLVPPLLRQRHQD